jgi:hypothetical protein
MKWSRFTLFVGFLLEISLFILVGVLLIPAVLISLTILPIAIIWAIVVGEGIKKQVLKEIHEVIDVKAN